jgi:large subunit ribosomal protein L1
MAGKRYTNARSQVDRERTYPPLDAVRTLKSLETAKFDETVEVHMRLGVNVRHADQQLRGTLFLPHGTGRSVTVAVFAQGEKAKEAEDAGADVVGADDLAARVQEGFTDFDVAIATPDMMGTVGRLGRILGPQGKMPSPKAGTITFDLAKAVSDIKAGKIEYRTDRTGIIHVAIGKKSFDEKALVENYGAVLDEILRAKPAAAKGRYLRSITITSTMGPGVKIDTGRVRDLMEETAAVEARPGVRPRTDLQQKCHGRRSGSDPGFRGSATFPSPICPRQRPSGPARAQNATRPRPVPAQTPPRLRSRRLTADASRSEGGESVCV